MLFKKDLPFVLSDCDGTIASKNYTVDEQTIKSIVNYQKKSGYRFSIITGRDYIVNKELIHDLKIQLPVISCNGSLITDPNSHKVLDAEYIDTKTCVEILRMADEIGLDVVCYTENAIVGLETSGPIQVWKTYRKNIGNKKYLFDLIIYNNLKQISDDVINGKVKPLTLIVTARDDKQKEKMNDVVKKFNEQIDLLQSMPFLFTLIKKGVSKGTAIKKWSDIVNTKLEDVVVFGDNYNDIPMFKEVKTKYAVGNAVDDLKQQATSVIGDVTDNGVGKQLESIIKEND